jgi:uncharacterized membrane protein YeaQ/YmgE (transglycosylase-associated protein family)
MRQAQKHKLFRIFPVEAGSDDDSCSILRNRPDARTSRHIDPLQGTRRISARLSVPLITEAAVKGTSMAIEALIITLIIGAVAGWLAGQIVKGYGFGLLGNIIVGIVGAFIAALILPAAGLTLGGGIVGAIIAATLGAVILLFLIRLIKRA